MPRHAAGRPGRSLPSDDPASGTRSIGLSVVALALWVGFLVLAGLAAHLHGWTQWLTTVGLLAVFGLVGDAVLKALGLELTTAVSVAGVGLAALAWVGIFVARQPWRPRVTV